MARRHAGGGAGAAAARDDLAEHLAGVGGEDAEPTRRVRIVLVSGGFDVEVTMTVLWLTEVFRLDVRCVRLTPHRVDGRLLVQLDQIIPLPEAAALKVRLQRREEAARVREADGRDLTKFVVTTPTGGTTVALNKRQALRELVVRLHADHPGAANHLGRWFLDTRCVRSGRPAARAPGRSWSGRNIRAGPRRSQGIRVPHPLALPAWA